jgi:hypothetical protein
MPDEAAVAAILEEVDALPDAPVVGDGARASV